MRLFNAYFLLIFLTGCSQNLGYGIGVTGVSSSHDSVAATEIIANNETGIHGNLTVDTDIRI